MKQTIIKWQTVNTRKKDKNYPEFGRPIVYRVPVMGKHIDPNEKVPIMTCRVLCENGELYVKNGFLELPIQNGFQWCYLDDTEDVDE